MRVRDLKEDLMMFDNDIPVCVNNNDIKKLVLIKGIRATDHISEITGEYIWEEVEYLNIS